MPMTAAFAHEWVQAWNRRDHYSDDIEFHSMIRLPFKTSHVVDRHARA